MIEKLPHGKLSEVKMLLTQEGIIESPRPRPREFASQVSEGIRAVSGIDLTYRLDIPLGTFIQFHQDLLLLVYQEMSKYKTKYPEAWFYAQVKFRLLYLRGISEEERIRSPQTAYQEDPEVAVYGPGEPAASTSRWYWLEKIFEDIINFRKHYPNISGIRIISLKIAIRERP